MHLIARFTCLTQYWGWFLIFWWVFDKILDKPVGTYIQQFLGYSTWGMHNASLKSRGELYSVLVATVIGLSFQAISKSAHYITVSISLGNEVTILWEKINYVEFRKTGQARAGLRNRPPEEVGHSPAWKENLFDVVRGESAYEFLQQTVRALLLMGVDP